MPGNYAVIGMGFVGLSQAIALAKSGHNVIGVENDTQKLRWLENYAQGKRDDFPLYEKDLDVETREQFRARRLTFTNNLEHAVNNSEAMFIAVGTPSLGNGKAKLSIVYQVANNTAGILNKNQPYLWVTKSTVPPGTAEIIRDFFKDHNVGVVSNPEFMAEGTALKDTMYPDRVVVGAQEDWVITAMRQLYSSFLARSAGHFRAMDNVSAEITKYQANVQLAANIVMANIGANLARVVGGDWEKIRLGVGDDIRQSRFNKCSLGFGGSCFPKDVRQYRHTLEQAGASPLDLAVIDAMIAQNEEQKLVMNNYMTDYYGHDLTEKVIGIWGLTFKAGTSDTRESSSLAIIKDLIRHGATVRVYDPKATREEFEETLGLEDTSPITYCDTKEEAIKDTHALIIPTEWSEFSNPGIQTLQDLMTNPVIFDGRDILDIELFRNTEASYFSVGRQPLINTT
ncbi:UDP-glucose/GDP-mannose dehydrogenase family protein [archaeon]|nr:UDP-glucose/GDP-mannose dehydrogenase family protein [archaeon]